MDLVTNADKTVYINASESEDRRRIEGDFSIKGLPHLKYLRETVSHLGGNSSDNPEWQQSPIIQNGN